MIREQDKASYFQEIEDFLLEMRKLKLDAIEAGLGHTDNGVIECLRLRWRLLIDRGLVMFPQPRRKSRLGLGKISQGKTRSLLLRLKDLEDCVFVFLEDFEVDYTNNRAEQSARGSKVRQSVSKCFRTVAGLNLFAAISSILDTGIKNGILQDEMIEAVYAGTAEGLLKAVLV